MNEIEFNHPLLRYEKQATYVWMILGGLLLFSGLFVDVSWLNNVGTKHLNYNLPIYLRYVSFIKPLSIIAGSFLFFAFLLKTQFLKLYQTHKFKPEILLIIFILLIFVTLSFVAYVPFKDYPYSMDEYNFLYQAKMFSQGKLFLEVPESYKPFVEQYMVFRDNKLFSKYPPGFSLLLSIGVLLNHPGLINPLIAVTTLFVLFCLVKSFLGPKYGMLSVILMSTTPYFIAYSASYYTHPTALLLTTLIFFFVRKYEIARKDLYLPVIGFLAGYSFLTRPLDSFCAVVPAYAYLTYIMYKDKNLRKITYSIFTFSIVFALFLVYNYILIGRITIAVYPVASGEFKVIDPHSTGIISNIISISNSYIANGIKYLPKLLSIYLLVPCALFVPLFAIFGVFNFRSKWKWVLLLNYVMLILMYNFHPGFGWPSYGSRYYYSGFVSLVVLATVAFKQLIEMLKNKKLIYHFLALVLCTHLIFSATEIWAYSYRFKIWTEIREDLINTCPAGSIVILNNPTALSHSNSNPLRIANFVDLVDAQRNPFMDTSRLIAIKDEHLYIPPLNLSEIKSNFPNHSICYYNFDIIRNK
jgi:Dolichyl-phosphate-mannose-protein mannosyltransferase